MKMIVDIETLPFVSKHVASFVTFVSLSVDFSVTKHIWVLFNGQTIVPQTHPSTNKREIKFVFFFLQWMESFTSGLTDNLLLTFDTRCTQ